MMDDMVADKKEVKKNWGREEKETKDVVANVNEKRKQLRVKRKKESLKIIEEKADKDVVANVTVKRKKESLKNIEEKADKDVVANVTVKRKQIRVKRKKESLKNIEEKADKDAVANVTVKRKQIRVKRKKESLKNIEEKSDCEVAVTKSKKVKFSDKVEVFPTSGRSKRSNEGGLVLGKRFSKEEDEVLKKAISDYIEANQLGEEGLNMVLNSRSHPSVRGCWKEIAKALHGRLVNTVSKRAHRLYKRGESSWTPEEVEFIMKSYKQYGPNWKRMADELGRHSNQVRGAFQYYKFGNVNKGHWSQHEYETLFELVNKDMQMCVFEERKSRYGFLKDNLKWEAISEKLGTRHTNTCCVKWYNQLTSPMVVQGNWADSDDYRLLTVLFELDASSEDEVDWDNLLEHRSGDLCRERWLQMVRHLGENGNKTFSRQVEVLSKRYFPEMEDVREALDARPIVD